MPIKVALVGSFWPGSLEASYQRAFTSLGVETIEVDFEKALAAEVGGSGPLRHLIGDRAAMKAAVSIEHEIIAAKPDLVLVFKGRRLPPDFLARIAPHAGVLANFNPDSPWEKANSSRWLIESIPMFHHHFTWSKQLIDRFAGAGASATHYLPFAYDPELHSSVISTEKDFDIVFIGTYEHLRDETLATLADRNVAIWGNDWHKSKLVPKSWIKGRAIYGKDAAEAMSGGVVNLNILRVQNEGSHNMRTFEIPATGNLMLTTKTLEQQEFFVEGDEILSYEGSSQLTDQVAWAIANTEEASRIGALGLEKVRPETYAKRASEILTVCGFV